MKRWIKTGVCALTLGVLLSTTVLAAEISISLDKQGTTAAVGLQGAGTDRYAAEVTFSLNYTGSIQFAGNADNYAMTIDSTAGTVTLYAASRNPLPVMDGTLNLGTLRMEADTEMKGPGQAIVLDRTLNRTTYSDVNLKIEQQGTDGGGEDSNPDDNGSNGSNGGSDNGSNGGSDNGSNGSNSSSGSDSDSGSSADNTPSVSVDGTGGKVRANSDGRVIITPNDGYRIAKILVNGKEVEISTRLTGLKATDQVVVTFEKIGGEIQEAPAEVELSFTDVQPTDWYADAVRFAVSRGLFQGMSDTEFAPNVEMSRGMLVTVLYRMSGEQAQAGSDFEDVSADAWYAQAVAWAKTNGIVAGVSETQFDPDRSVTREQMAAILYRYAQRSGAQAGSDAGSLQAFADAAAVSEYAVPAMGWAVQKGLISGMGDQTLAPAGSATRAQVASILQRFMGEN